MIISRQGSCQRRGEESQLELIDLKTELNNYEKITIHFRNTNVRFRSCIRSKYWRQQSKLPIYSTPKD